MRIYLLKDLPGKGKKGDIIDVNDGYGRNFVIKNKYGQIVDNSILAKIESQKSAKNFHTGEDIKRIKDVIGRLEKITVSINAPMGANGKMFGSITSTDIASGLSKEGFDIDKRNIVLTEPIKNSGSYKIKVKFSHSLEGSFNLLVEAK